MSSRSLRQANCVNKTSPAQHPPPWSPIYPWPPRSISAPLGVVPRDPCLEFHIAKHFFAASDASSELAESERSIHTLRNSNCALFSIALLPRFTIRHCRTTVGQNIHLLFERTDFDFTVEKCLCLMKIAHARFPIRHNTQSDHDVQVCQSYA